MTDLLAILTPLTILAGLVGVGWVFRIDRKGH